MHASLWAWPRLSASFSAAKIASGWRRSPSDRSRPLKHIQRAKIVLHSSERLAVLEVARGAGVSRPPVWRWQLCYAEEGVDGLLRDKTRKPGRAPLSQKIIAKVLLLGAARRHHPLGSLRPSWSSSDKGISGGGGQAG